MESLLCWSMGLSFVVILVWSVITIGSDNRDVPPPWL